MLLEDADVVTISRPPHAGSARVRADFWVFAYGSLIWNPGFPYKSREPARLAGFRRAYCIRSQVYRGTPQAPGLVLGLETGGVCEGVAYCVAGELHAETMQYLRERELITNVYDERLVAIETRDGARHDAYAYVANPAHEQYVAMADFDALVETIAGAAGVAGPNCEYALNTWSNLAGLGICDALVERVAEALRRREAPLTPPAASDRR
ncbi:MAG: gamma-glutamylcyclotransferase [Pseudomonadota bacterium]|nr:gamma-glutamylcyclotransferase [Pseudomonadota bacterium]